MWLQAEDINTVCSATKKYKSHHVIILQFFFFLSTTHQVFVSFLTFSLNQDFFESHNYHLLSHNQDFYLITITFYFIILTFYLVIMALYLMLTAVKSSVRVTNTNNDYFNRT